MNWWIAQIFGALAIACSLIIYSRNDRKKLLIFKCIQDVCWLTHYLLLVAYSAVASSALGIVRSIAYYSVKKSDDKKGLQFLLLALFLVLFALSAVLTWKNVFSIFPALGSSISTVAFWMKNPRHTKVLSIFASSSTLTYNVTVARSASVYVGATITILTSLYSLFIKGKKRKDIKTEETA